MSVDVDDSPPRKAAGRKKGFKVSTKTREKMIAAWERPERKAAYVQDLIRRGIRRRSHTASGSSPSWVDEDFDEWGQ